jgi:hypothetical protein
MSDLTDTPTSPPAPPVIPIGLGTSTGLGTAAALFVGGVVSLFIDGDHTPETIMSFAAATVTLVTVLAGRFAQAYALYRDAPSVRNVLGVAGSLLPTDEEISEFEATRAASQEQAAPESSL